MSGGPGAGRTLLRCRDVSVRRDRREVVSDASLELRAGEIVALLGPNGAGKSTLLDALAGALEPAAGRSSATAGSRSPCRPPTSPGAPCWPTCMLALAWWGVPRPERPHRARRALEAIGGRATWPGARRPRCRAASAAACTWRACWRWSPTS